jgi:hypothetical protein
MYVRTERQTGQRQTGKGENMLTGNSCDRAVKAIAIATLVVAVTGSAALSVASANDARRSAAQDTAGRAGAAGAAGAPAPSGVWRMDGYGTVLTVQRGRVQEYRTTKSSCLKGTSADRVGGHGGTARYETNDGEVFALRSAGSRERASMHVYGSEGDRHLRRIAELPDACGRKTPKDR